MFFGNYLGPYSRAAGVFSCGFRIQGGFCMLWDQGAGICVSLQVQDLWIRGPGTFTGLVVRNPKP